MLKAKSQEPQLLGLVLIGVQASHHSGKVASGCLYFWCTIGTEMKGWRRDGREGYGRERMGKKGRGRKDLLIH